MSANFLPFLDKLGFHSVIAEHARTVVQTWSSWTGQVEGWSLYAPRVPKQAPFAATELIGDMDTASAPNSLGSSVHEIRATTEPLDPQDFFRPWGTSRLAAYEANLSLVYWGWNADADSNPVRWRRHIAEHVARHEAAIHAYMRWQLASWRDANPGAREPRAAILRVRLYPIPEPTAEHRTWDRVIDLPVARWRLDVGSGTWPIEPYDPVQGRFAISESE